MIKTTNRPIFGWRAAVLALVFVLAIAVAPAMADNPIANFTAVPTSGTAPLSVQFTDGSTGESIIEWAWDFDNNGAIDNTTQNPSYFYPVRGTYSVNLTVTNASGSNSMLKPNYISVTGPRTWTVGASGSDFTILTDAIGNASVVDGDTIFVYNGTYTFTGLTKSITLTGESADLVTINLGDATRTITGTRTVIRLVKFTNGRLSFPTTSPGATNMIVRDCIFESLKNPTAANGAINLLGTNNTLSGNIFRNNVVYNLIYTGSGVNNRIENNTFTNTSNTATLKGVVRLSAPVGNIIRNNSFTDNNMPCILLQSNIGSGNRIYLNNFVVPTGVSPVAVQGTYPAPTLAWISSEPLDYLYQGNPHNGYLGNYFNTYPGSDADGDGIGDSPYPLVTNHIDTAPLMDRTQFYFGATHSPIASVNINPVSATVNVTQIKQFTATATDTDGLNVPGLTYIWASSNETVGTVNGTGFFSALAAGTTTITASNSGISNTSDVTVVLRPPIVNFTAVPLNGGTPLVIQFTDTSTNGPTAWAWDVNNDGTVDYTTRNATHTYTLPGIYSVNLTASNDAGSSSLIKANLINVTAGVPIISVVPNTTTLASGSTTQYQLVVTTLPAGLAGFNLTVALDHPAVGEITAVSIPAWAALNGTSTLPADTVTFNAVDLNRQVEPGTTNVLLGTITVRADAAGTTGINATIRKMDDDNGDAILPVINNGQLEVFAPLVANFSAEPLSGFRPLTVNFTDLSTGDPLPAAWAWDFENDGTIDSTAQSPSHTYAAAGTYAVNLTVSNTFDTDSVVKALYIHVQVLVQAFPGYTNLPTDPDGDGLYEDINGNGRLDFDDVVAYYYNMAWMNANTAVGTDPYDFNNNDRVDFDDVVVLYNEVLAW